MPADGPAGSVNADVEVSTPQCPTCVGELSAVRPERPRNQATPMPGAASARRMGPWSVTMVVSMFDDRRDRRRMSSTIRPKKAPVADDRRG
jgi:hypothetical protein